MDVRINELESKVQPFGGGDRIEQIVREKFRAMKDEEEREKRAESERSLCSGISTDRR